MDIEFHADIYADEAIVRYRVAKDSPDGDEINLKQVERIDDIVGVQVLYLPTCACGCIVESWSMLDRRVYDALVNAGMLQAKIYEIEVELNGSYSRPPTVTFECEVTHRQGFHQPSLRRGYSRYASVYLGGRDEEGVGDRGPLC